MAGGSVGAPPSGAGGAAEVEFEPGVTTTTQLRALSTTGYTLPKLVIAMTAMGGTQSNQWWVRTGSDVTDEAAGIQRPDDWASGVNEKIFEKIA